MKKVLGILAVLGLMASPAFAKDIHNTVNVEGDLPHLIGIKQISPDLYFGVNASKGVAENLFYSDFHGIEDDKNYYIGAKITYEGCWVNCPSK